MQEKYIYSLISVYIVSYVFYICVTYILFGGKYDIYWLLHCSPITN